MQLLSCGSGTPQRHLNSDMLQDPAALRTVSPNREVAMKKVDAVKTFTTMSISDLDALGVLDEADCTVSHGCDQKWFASPWQRRTGCGPTAASNLLLYRNRSRRNAGNFPCKTDALKLMDEVWNYMTPGDKGIPTTEMFRSSVYGYGTAKGLRLRCLSCDIPEEKKRRPALAEVTSFLETALADDVATAFLNLCNGQEKNLEGWHWVTVVSVEKTAKDASKLFIRILDEGVIKRVDLPLWLNTTERGGGFVRLVDGD